jgi:hypothetical protein
LSLADKFVRIDISKENKKELQMNRYKCDNHRFVKSESIKEAAKIFAKRKYPRCDHFIITLDCYNNDSATYHLFAGKYNKRNRSSVGVNDQITISIV